MLTILGWCRSFIVLISLLTWNIWYLWLRKLNKLLLDKGKVLGWGFAWVLRLFSKIICLSMTLTATFWPLVPLTASLTLEKLPSPMVLTSWYLPIFFSNPIALLAKDTGSFEFMMMCVANCMLYHFAMTWIQFIGKWYCLKNIFRH